MLLEFMLLDIMDSLANWMERYRSYEEIDSVIQKVIEDERQNGGKGFQEIVAKRVLKKQKE